MQPTTTIFRRAFGAILLSGAVALAAACKSTPAGPDPAQANLAPVNGQPQVLGQNVSYSPQQQGEYYPQQQGAYPQQAPAPIQQGYPQQGYPQQPGYDDSEIAGEQALDETTQPPPELPEYDQPPAPGPGYMWTPGYWAWGPGGYYWVPGAWVEAPYYGALWTPPYWGWYNGFYRFHPGYWGRHVGYYGGIDYGFGYIGIGYFGGYWSGNNFYYNSAVTRVAPGFRNVYERPVIYNNVRYGVQPSNRVSYNGGHGGINMQPRPAEIAAMHEPHSAPLAVQHQVRVEASQNRAQFYNENHGRPSQAYAPQGFAHGGAPAQPMPAGRPSPETHYPQPNPAYSHAQPQPYAGGAHYENRPQPQPQQQPYAGHFDNRAQPQPQPQQPRVEQPRANQPQPNAPRFDHQPSTEPQPHAEYRPQPQPQPRMEPPRVENHPQPQPQQQHVQAPQNRPAPQQQPHPQPQQNHPAPQQQSHGGGGNHEEHGHR